MGADAVPQKEQPSGVTELLRLLIPGQLAKKLTSSTADKVKAATPKK